MSYALFLMFVKKYTGIKIAGTAFIICGGVLGLLFGIKKSILKAKRYGLGLKLKFFGAIDWLSSTQNRFSQPMV